jgi:hypothetical protein
MDYHNFIDHWHIRLDSKIIRLKTFLRRVRETSKMVHDLASAMERTTNLRIIFS